MVDVTETGAIQPVKPYGHQQQDRRQKHGKNRDSDEPRFEIDSEAQAPPEPVAGPPEPRPSFVDPTVVMGIPSEEMTDRVREAVDALVAEVEHLRHDLEHAREYTRHLEEKADAHPFLPLVNRHAFLREMGLAIDRAARAQVASSLAVFHVLDGEDLWRRYGAEAFEAAQARTAEILSGCLEPADMAGCVGGADFGLVLALADEGEAAARAEQLCLEMAEAGVPWSPGPLPLVVAWGVHAFGDGETPDSALAAARRNLHDRLEPPDTLTR